MSEALRKTIEGFGDFLLEYFLVLAAAGALAMATVELFKKLLDARTRFHARATTRWLLSWGHGGEDGLAELLHLAAGITRDEARCRARELITQNGALTGWIWLNNDQANTAFSLETERMMVTFQDAADLSLTSPGLYPQLFAFVTMAADPQDRDKWKEDAAQVPGAELSSPEEMKARAERYARLRQAVKRKLDAFQTFTEMQWANRTQLWANIVGTAVLGAAFVVSAWTGAIAPADWPLAVVFSIFGGMLAPLAKDVVGALQQVRQPRPE
jgi:hypothetical protein